MRLGPLAAVAIVTAGCSVNEQETTPVAPQLASGQLVPARCAPAATASGATVAFVANGAAWALDPRTGRLSCLFGVERPGPFAWGPRGDRALLARLEVKGLGDAPSRAPSGAAPASASWGRPIGKSIVFVGRRGRALLKAHPAGGGFRDVTPMRGVRYERVVYHPSGLAFAFVVRDERESLWISSNVGKEPRQLVHGEFHTDFEAIAFAPDGATIYFAAQHAAGRVDVHSLGLHGATEAPVEWRGGPHEHVTDIVAGRDGTFAITVGRSCETRRALVVTARHPQIDAFDAPSRAVGWIDDRTLLVAAGACGRPVDLYAVSVPSLRLRLLVRSVNAAATRRPERLPPPPLPRSADVGEGFA